jgi:hypothetical protein
VVILHKTINELHTKNEMELFSKLTSKRPTIKSSDHSFNKL